VRAQICVVALAALAALPVAAQQNAPSDVRHITLAEAVQLALKHNHLIRIAGYSVEESQRAKDVARSAYYPKLRNDSSYLHVTDTQFIARRTTRRPRTRRRRATNPNRRRTKWRSLSTAFITSC
jgi:outer membrane protein TolC